jgi:RimJ/RimL family protein N-acetyltransferase/predicted acetyltransferase
MHSDHVFIETSRLLIKAPSFDDFAAICELNANPEVMRYIEICRPQSKVREFLEKAINHFQKHGFSFGTVIEKSSNRIIGQAGILYLAYDDTQPEIEIGYRLHPDYWHKGYATELARILIEWGFKHLSINKLIAVIQPENQASRRVLERVGMHYVGRIEAYNTTVAKYEIDKINIDFSEIKLIPAKLADYPIIQNMGRFYVYDMSEYMGWNIPDDGLYECIDFKKYWETTDAYPFLIRYRHELVGFAIVDKKGSDATIDFNMAQFFILRKFKKKGIGAHVAHLCFNQFKGVWEVMVIPGNESAYRFWRKIITKYTHSHFTEYTREISHFKNNIKNIFKFDSKEQ